MPFDLFTVLAVILWLAAAPRLRDLRSGTPASRRSVAFAITALAVATTVFASAPRRILNDVSGVPHLHDLAGRTALMVAAVSAQCIFLTLRPTSVEPSDRAPSRDAPGDTSTTTVVRRRVRILGVAVLVLVATFVLTQLTVHPDPGLDLITTQSGHVSVAAYVATFTALLGWCFLDLVRAWVRLRHQVEGSLGVGLALLAAGAVAGLGYVLLRGVGVLAALAPWPAAAAFASWGCILTGTACAVLVMLGISWHAVARGVARLRAWRADRRRLLSLGPLWRELVAVTPGIALQPPSRGGRVRDRLTVTGLRWRVYRRVIEIYDGSLALQRTPLRRNGSHDPSGRSHRRDSELATTVALIHEVQSSRATTQESEPAVASDQGRVGQIDRLVGIAEDHASRRLADHAADENIPHEGEPRQ